MTQAYPALPDFYGANLTRGTHAPFPNPIEALDDLEARGVKVAIVTNKLEQFIVQLVPELALDHRFICAIGDDHGWVRAMPNPRSCRSRR